MFLSFIASANAGPLYKCIDKDKIEIITDHPQDEMKKCELLDSNKETSPLSSLNTKKQFIRNSAKKDAIWFVNLLKKNNGKYFCVPSEKTIKEISQSLVNYSQSQNLPDVTYGDQPTIERLAAIYPCNSSDAVTGRPNIITEKKGKITSMRTEGSLESKQDVGCHPVSELKNTYTPADLYRGVVQCIALGQYTVGAEMYMLGNMYGLFDAERVADRTAAQGIIVLQMEAFSNIDKQKINKINKTLSVDLKKGGSARTKLCSDIRSLGYPAYYPSYMILHGIKAFHDSPYQNAIKKDFDAEKTWNGLLKKNCT
jgi:hypothetical protein